MNRFPFAALLLIATAASAPEALNAQQRATARSSSARQAADTTTRPRATPSESPARDALARADSAYKDGDRARALELYEEAITLDSSQSRAVFRLGQLEPSRARALAWFRHYQALEPRDPWGMMAEGDLLGRHGQYRDALVAYDRAAAIAPDERDVAVGRARLHERAGHANQAVAELSGWTARHGGDAEAWDQLGRVQMRIGRPRAAATSFARAREAGGVPGIDERLTSARAQAAPAIEPVGGYMRDSDGNRSTRVGGVADVMVSDGLRLGAGAERITIGDGVTSAAGFAGYGRLTARPTASARLDVQGGVLRLASPVATGGDWTTPQGDLRLRLRAPNDGPSLELRGQRLALGMSPLLVEHRVARTEGRAIAEIPVGPLRLRGIGRAGTLAARGEPSNTRLGAEGGLLIPLGSALQLGGQYRWMGYQRATTAGYFAPRQAETIDGGAYFEVGSDGPFSFAADLGAGVQRVAEQGGAVGQWTRALRGWGYASFALGPSRALYAEVEAYDAPFAPEGVATVGNWRFVSLNTGIRWALR